MERAERAFFNVRLNRLKQLLTFITAAISLFPSINLTTLLGKMLHELVVTREGTE